MLLSLKNRYLSFVGLFRLHADDDGKVIDNAVAIFNNVTVVFV